MSPPRIPEAVRAAVLRRLAGPPPKISKAEMVDALLEVRGSAHDAAVVVASLSLSPRRVGVARDATARVTPPPADATAR